MAVFFEAASQGGGDWVGFGNAVDVEFTHTSRGGTCAIVGLSFACADLSLGPFVIGDNSLTSLTRSVTYNGVAMTSVGVIQWSTSQVWTQVFAIFNVPAGKATVRGKVYGGSSSHRTIRAACATYTGADSVGTPITGSGSGTSMSIAATAAVADRLIAVFGTKDGIASFNQTQRTLTNADTAMLIGDANGSGSSLSSTATRQKTGVWGGIVVPLIAAATVVDCDPLVVEPMIEPEIRREPRLGGLRRQVFKVPVDEEDE